MMRTPGTLRPTSKGNASPRSLGDASCENDSPTKTISRRMRRPAAPAIVPLWRMMPRAFLSVAPVSDARSIHEDTRQARRMKLTKRYDSASSARPRSIRSASPPPPERLDLRRPPDADNATRPSVVQAVEALRATAGGTLAVLDRVALLVADTPQ